jgi:Meckel syndrome type 1 protein
VPLQREAEGEEAAPSVAHLPVPARWGAGDDLPATVHATDRPAPAPDAVPLQRFAAPDAAAPQPVPAPSVATPSDGWRGAHSPALGSPSLAASAGPLRAAGSTPAPAPVTRTATASPAPTLQLARPPAAAPAPVVVVPAPAAPPAGRIEAPVVSPSAPAPTVQTSPAAGASGLPAFTATPVVQREPGTAPPVQGGQTGHTDRELDELAKQLFGRVRGQLRAEMISEREARGLSFDAF